MNNFIFGDPLQILSILLGGALFFVGNALHFNFSNEKINQRGFYLMYAGAIIGFPGFFALIFFTGMQNDFSIFPAWLFPSISVVFPLLGVAVAIWGWIEAGNENRKA